MYVLVTDPTLSVVFGRVLEGLDVVDKLQNVTVDRSGRPSKRVVSYVPLGSALCCHQMPMFVAAKVKKTEPVLHTEYASM